MPGQCNMLSLQEQFKRVGGRRQCRRGTFEILANLRMGNQHLHRAGHREWKTYGQGSDVRRDIECSKNDVRDPMAT